MQHRREENIMHARILTGKYERSETMNANRWAILISDMSHSLRKLVWSLVHA